MDWISFAFGVGAGVVGTILFVGVAMLGSVGDQVEHKPTLSPSRSTDDYRAQVRADAIRRLGASGAISAEDAERIAREHVEWTGR